jgi:hypothetical protein
MFSLFKVWNDFKAYRNYRKDYHVNPYGVDYFYAIENIDSYTITVDTRGVKAENIGIEFIKSTKEKKVVITLKETTNMLIKRTEIYIVGSDANLSHAQAHISNGKLSIMMPKYQAEEDIITPLEIIEELDSID